MSARRELEFIISLSDEEPDNHLLRNAAMLSGIGAIGIIGHKGGRLMDTIRKSYKAGAKEIVGRTGPAVEAVRAAADNIQNATAWTSDVGRLWGAANGPQAVKMVTQGMAHTKSVPAHFRQGLTNEGSADTLGGRIGRRIGRAWKSARDSFNSAPAGMPVHMSAREELNEIRFGYSWSADPLKVEAQGGWDVAKARIETDEGGFMDENIARNKKRGVLNAIKRLNGRPRLNPFLYHDKAGHSAAFKKANPHWETNSTGMFSARDQLNEIVEFGIFSMGTAKKVFRGLQGGAERSPLVRPSVFGVGPSFIPKNSPKESLGMLSSMYESPAVRPGATLVPRLSAEAQEAAAAILPKGAKGIFKDPVAIAAHERGHAYDPKIEARQAMQYKRAEQMQKQMGDKAPFEDPKTKPIAQKLMAGMLEHESVANRRVMDQVRQHGTPQEADAWKKYANNQMKVGYRAPMFEGGTAGKSLTEKKDFLRENSFLRRSATALEARSKALFFNTSNSAGRSDKLSARDQLNLIEFRMLRDPNDERTQEEKWADFHILKAKIQSRAAMERFKKSGKWHEPSEIRVKLSAREALGLITLGVDANGKLHNSKGEFGGDNDAVAHPEAMRATYQRAAGLGATAGAAGVAGGMGMKALVEKLKGLKRK